MRLIKQCSVLDLAAKSYDWIEIGLQLEGMGLGCGRGVGALHSRALVTIKKPFWTLIDMEYLTRILFSHTDRSRN
ncbi:MAG: hypothetical protein P8H31_09125 [Porticoccaceae bacterium]|nr:hypothetical protein [Porticoccaceae bacterium]